MVDVKEADREYAKWLAGIWLVGDCPMYQEGCRENHLCWHCLENAQVDFEVRPRGSS